MIVHVVTHGLDYDSGGQVFLFSNRRAARHAHDLIVKSAKPGEFVDLDTLVVHDTYWSWRSDPDTPQYGKPVL